MHHKPDEIKGSYDHGFAAGRAESAAEIERLRAIGLYLVQHENGGHCVRQNGIPCRETNKCGCYLEFENLKIGHQQRPKKST